MNEWISVKNRIPEYNTEILIIDGEYIRIGDCWENHCAIDDEPKQYFSSSDGYMKVTHWMPLPELPK